jgi:hypothetical protein
MAVIMALLFAAVAFIIEYTSYRRDKKRIPKKPPREMGIAVLNYVLLGEVAYLNGLTNETYEQKVAFDVKSWVADTRQGFQPEEDFTVTPAGQKPISLEKVLTDFETFRFKKFSAIVSYKITDVENHEDHSIVTFTSKRLNRDVIEAALAKQVETYKVEHSDWYQAQLPVHGGEKLDQFLRYYIYPSALRSIKLEDVLSHKTHTSKFRIEREDALTNKYALTMDELKKLTDTLIA